MVIEKEIQEIYNKNYQKQNGCHNCYFVIRHNYKLICSLKYPNVTEVDEVGICNYWEKI